MESDESQSQHSQSTVASVPTVVDDKDEDGTTKKLELSNIIEFLRRHNFKVNYLTNIN